MTESFAAGAAAALWLGILTSISPCPMTTNIAAVSFIGKNVGKTGRVLTSGAAYTTGRAIAYSVLGALIVAGILSVPGVSFFLQRYMHKLLGPALVVSGILILGIIPLKIGISFDAEKIGRRAERGGLLSAALLGLVFALAFCPVSAAIFFGSLIPLSLKHSSRIVLPLIYGVGTGLPVLFFAFLIATGAGSVGKYYNALKAVELWARRVTGAVFIGAGMYLIYVTFFS